MIISFLLPWNTFESGFGLDSTIEIPLWEFSLAQRIIISASCVISVNSYSAVYDSQAVTLRPCHPVGLVP